MDRKITIGILFGIVVGILAGVELVQYSGIRACPENICLDETQIIPLSDKGYFPEVHKILQDAKNSIHMAMFELKYYETYSNSSANILVRDLIEARKRGVDVKIIIDQFSEENNAFNLLKEQGIEIKMDSENITTHAKLIIVDGRVVILGSTNLSYFGLEKNNEVDVVLVSKQTAEYYEKYFWNLWNSI